MPKVINSSDKSVIDALIDVYKIYASDVKLVRATDAVVDAYLAGFSGERTSDILSYWNRRKEEFLKTDVG